ncbi:hypothetical protein [Streptomyces sp. NPDC056061]|uniref:hypothetical protein n=1 Tax=Streptomyces sp. NPDC056061 TaxID=3345700 RepID=UPI0035DBFB6D
MPHRIVICPDGTSNQVGACHPTNVVRLFDTLEADALSHQLLQCIMPSRLNAFVPSTTVAASCRQHSFHRTVLRHAHRRERQADEVRYRHPHRSEHIP